MERKFLWFVGLVVLGLTTGCSVRAQSPVSGLGSGPAKASSAVSPTTTDPAVLRQGLISGNSAAYERVLQLVASTELSIAQRVVLLNLLSEHGRPDCVPRVLKLLALDQSPEVELAALETLSRFDDPAIPATLVQQYPRYSQRLKRACRQVLFGRKDWALAFLEQMDRDQLLGQCVTIDELRELEGLSDKQIHKQILKYWGYVSPNTPPERLAEVRQWYTRLHAGIGNSKAGKKVFADQCAKCHQMYGEGETIGPDLTAANRKDREYVLTSLVDPSDYIRADYLPVQVVTTGGRILQGLVLDDNESALTLVDSNAEKSKVPHGEIDEIVSSHISQMPEGLLKPLSLEQVRDLLAFLESDSQPAGYAQGRAASSPPPL